MVNDESLKKLEFIKRNFDISVAQIEEQNSILQKQIECIYLQKNNRLFFDSIEEEKQNCLHIMNSFIKIKEGFEASFTSELNKIDSEERRNNKEENA